MKKFTRQQEIVMDIADYLTDWTSTPDSVMEFDESIKCIESYGVNFEDSCDELLTNAIRHLEYVINPWNKKDIPEILMIMFEMTEEECYKYWAQSIPMGFVFG